MKIGSDILELFRAVLTILIFACAVFLSAIFSVPFLVTQYSSHQMLAENGVLYFLFTRLIVVTTIMLIAFSLLYLVGWLCEKKVSKITYLIVFMSCLSITIWMTINFLNDNL